MSIATRSFCGLVAIAVVAVFSCAAASAKDDDRQEQLRRLYGERGDPRCAAEGPGFIYSREARTCVRVGGLVGVQGSTSMGR